MSSQPEVSKEEFYLLNQRDEQEKDRLNHQNEIIRIIRNGCVLDLSIPKKNVSRIADIATGTGIWLRDLSSELGATGHKQPLEMVGFDVSPAQFPAASTPGTEYVVWDMTQRFEEKYHSSFDVVHVRLVTAAIKKDEVEAVVRNVVELLKPGGYLQWTEITYRNGRGLTYPSGDGELSCEAEGKRVFEFHGQQGLSLDTIGDVEASLESLPMEEVRLSDHTNAAHLRPEIRSEMAVWHSRSVTLFVEMMMRREGEGEEQAKKKAEAYRDKVLEMGSRGVIFEAPFFTLVARRKSEL